MERLRSTLRQIDGRGYGAYKELNGQRYAFDVFTLNIDHVQGDPFASPSRVHMRIPQQAARFPKPLFETRAREIGLRDWLLRSWIGALKKVVTRDGGIKPAAMPGQEMLERSAVLVNEEAVEVRFLVQLPAAGRRVLGREAEDILVRRLPAAVHASLLFDNIDKDSVTRHVLTAEDADHLRGMLDEAGLVAFVADESVLPRKSGVEQGPLVGGTPFRSPESLRVEFTLPNRGRVVGMGVPKGVTLVVGGGFHGKSTLLRALERGVYNHVPGDGRELVVTDPTAVKIRAEDGRSVAGVDISPFISGLPGGLDTRAFSTPNASGATSQAANIIEALESGCSVLLLDEDSSATNFMIRDRRMEALIAKNHEPITPFLDRVRQIYEDMGVSTVLVMGGSGDYFDVADTVISMVEYVPVDSTAEARDVALTYPTGREGSQVETFAPSLSRRSEPGSLNPAKGRKSSHTRPRGLKTLTYGENDIDLTAIEQLVEHGQVEAIGQAMAGRVSAVSADIKATIDRVERLVEESGLDALASRPHPGNLTYFRPQELAAAINRLRTLRLTE